MDWRAVRELAIDRRISFLEGLLPSSDERDPPVLQHRNEWDRMVNREYPIRDDETWEIAEILREKVEVNGVAVKQRFSRSLGASVAAMSCENRTPVILYNVEAIAELSPPALRFIKEHEIAHIREADLNCTTLKEKQGRQEKTADCHAAQTLSLRGQEGNDAVAAIAQHFYQLNEGRKPPYESSATRSRYLFRRCS